MPGKVSWNRAKELCHKGIHFCDAADIPWTGGTRLFDIPVPGLWQIRPGAQRAGRMLYRATRRVPGSVRSVHDPLRRRDAARHLCGFVAQSQAPA